MKPTLPILFVSLALTACAAAAPATVATSAPPRPAPAPVVVQAPSPAPTPAPAPAVNLAAGQAAFERGCFACHDQSAVAAKGGLSRADWRDVVIAMQDRGFSASADEVKLIVDYLAATYPPKA